jgi:hypothetical protein
MKVEHRRSGLARRAVARQHEAAGFARLSARRGAFTARVVFGPSEM